MESAETYLSRTQAAQRLNRGPKTLRNLHKKRLGPPLLLIGDRPAYPLSRLEAWVAKNTFGGAS